MVQVVEYEEFKALVLEVTEIKSEIRFLKSLLLGERWLTRIQAMTALGCGHNKLRKLHLRNVLAFRYEGSKPYYDAFSIRTYLASKRIDSVEADERIIAARFSK